jgi:hypothetical protein
VVIATSRTRHERRGEEMRGDEMRVDETRADERRGDRRRTTSSRLAFPSSGSPLPPRRRGKKGAVEQKGTAAWCDSMRERERERERSMGCETPVAASWQIQSYGTESMGGLHAYSMV